MNFVKFLRTTFLQNTYGRLPLNQSSDSFSADLNSKEISIYETTLRRLRSHIYIYIYIYIYILVLFTKAINPSEKIGIVKEELDDIDIDDIEMILI